MQEEKECPRGPEETGGTMSVKQCPLLILSNTCGMPGWPITECLRDGCAWWNEHLGCCGVIVPGMIQGIEITRQEMATGWPPPDSVWED